MASIAPAADLILATLQLLSIANEGIVATAVPGRRRRSWPNSKYTAGGSQKAIGSLASVTKALLAGADPTNKNTTVT